MARERTSRAFFFGAKRTIGGLSFNKPGSITAGAEIASFVYGLERAPLPKPWPKARLESRAEP